MISNNFGMIDFVDFDKLATRLIRCENFSSVTPAEIQERFNRLNKKPQVKPRKAVSGASGPGKRRKELGRQLVLEAVVSEDAGLSREEKRISRQIFLMEQLEETKLPKKIKKLKNQIRVNDKFDWQGQTPAQFLEAYLVQTGTKKNEPAEIAPPRPILLEEFTDCTDQYRQVEWIKPLQHNNLV